MKPPIIIRAYSNGIASRAVAPDHAAALALLSTAIRNSDTITIRPSPAHSRCLAAASLLNGVNLAEYIRQMEDELAEAKRNRKVRLTCRDCGADGPLIGDLCAGCSDAAEAEDDDTANAPREVGAVAPSLHADVGMEK